MTGRLNVNINPETAAALVELSERQGCSMTEVVRRSIGAYKYLSDEVAADRVIVTENANGRKRRVLKFLGMS